MLCYIIYHHDVISKQSLNWYRFMNEMIWVKILLGNFKRKNYDFIKIIFKFCFVCSFRLNQSLQWPFREVIATSLYDFNPKEPNQLPLRQGCQVLVIGKEGDSKGWWRGKTMDRVGYSNKIILKKKTNF